jgi:hypothetical protein
LRTGDDTAGRQAKCPACQTVSTVPVPESPPQAAAAPPETPSPFATTAPWGEPAASPFAPRGPAEAENPYQAPAEYAPAEVFPGAFAQDRVSAPATGLIVTGSLGLAVQILGAVGTVLAVAFQPMARNNAFVGEVGVRLALGMLGICLSVLVIFAGVKMKNLENYVLSMTGAIIAVIPCFSPCCFLGIPFGIWAIVVLVSPEVKAAFR